MYLHPEGGKRRGPMPLGLFLFSVFWWSLAPDLRPATSGFRLAKQILVASFGTQVRARILGWPSYILRPRQGTTTAGSNAPGTFLVIINPPSGRGLVIPLFLSFVLFLFFFIFFMVTCSAKQIFVTNLSYTTWARILSDRNIFRTLRGGKTTAESNAPGAFLVIFLMVTCPRPPVFARLNKYSSCLSLHRQGLSSEWP